MRLIFSAVFLWSALLVNGQKDTLTLLHISDLHVIHQLDMYDQGLAGARRHYGSGIAPLVRFLNEMPAKTGADMVVCTGDLIDYFEGATPDGAYWGFQVEQFLQLTEKASVPVFLTLGNHDIVEYSWKDNRLASSQHVAGSARASWVRNAPCFRNGTYYSREAKVGNTNFRLIFLDNAFNNLKQQEGLTLPFLDLPQLRWLEKQLSASDNDVEIIFMHLPLTAASVNNDSPSGIYSLLETSNSVRMIVAGHNHANAIKRFPVGANKSLIQVQTGAFAQDNNHWRLLQLTEDAVLVSLPGEKVVELMVPVPGVSLPARGLCAHRGAMATHPENTLPAFQAAIDAGAHMIEFDVTLTRDSQMVVIHDSSVDRTTNGKGKVADFTLREIKKLDAGSWKSPEFKGVKVPLLDEVLQIMPRNIWLNVHIKGPDRIASMVAEKLASENRLHQAFLACGANAAREARQTVPDILICNMDRSENPMDYVSETINSPAGFIQLTKPIVPEFANYVAMLKQKGIKVNYYGTDKTGELRQLFDYGIDFPLVNDIINLMPKVLEMGIPPVKQK